VNQRLAQTEQGIFRKLYIRTQRRKKKEIMAKMKLVSLAVVLTMGLVLLPNDANAFVAITGNMLAKSHDRRSRSLVVYADSWDSNGASSLPPTGGGGAGSIEQIEFKIYPDGRVEETVRGVKGNNCHKVTEKINEALGKVVASSPTEEMFEEQVQVQQKIYQSESDWEGSSSW
jgi:hypothetical protein